MLKEQRTAILHEIVVNLYGYTPLKEYYFILITLFFENICLD